MAESEGGCSGCAYLQAQVRQLQQRVAQLEQQNQNLRQRIEWLQRIIQLARATCQHYMRETGQVLAQRSGVPRARWAYCKGGYAVAARILAVLSQGEG